MSEPSVMWTPGQASRASALRAALVVGVEIGVDEVDDQRLGTGRPRRPGGLPHRVLVERGHHRTGRVDPLRHLEAALARHDRREVAHHAPRVGPGAPAELQRVAKAPRGDEGAAHPLALQHGVGADGGAVDHRLEFLRRLAERGEAGHEAVRLVGRRGRYLGDAHGARGRIDQQQVGEGAADIDAEPAAAGRGAHGVLTGPLRGALSARPRRPRRRGRAGRGPPARRASAPAPCAAGGRKPRRS